MTRGMQSVGWRSGATLAITCGALLCSASARAQDSEQKTGSVIPKVACVKAPQQTYALYLPAAYKADKKWPVLFCFAPDGVGQTPVNLLKNAAEKYGYILIGSNNAKNGPGEPIIEAIGALWDEANTRYSSDPRRSYATGFSGGARMAMLMAVKHTDHFAGVIPCGAFVPGGPDEFPQNFDLAVYGLVGREDPNYAEFEAVENKLGDRIPALWIQVFDGTQQWPSAAQMGRALEFMQTAAMQKKMIPEDGSALKAFVASSLDAAQARAKDEPMLAMRDYRQIAKLFPGVEGAASAKERADALAKTPEVQAVMEQRATLAANTARLGDKDDAAFDEAMAWFRKTAAAGDAAGREARQAIGMAYMQFQAQGVEAIKSKDYEKAAFVFDRACKIAPQDASAAYNAACAYSLLGKKPEALRLLKAAVTAGFNDADHIAKDTDLDNIRNEPEYQAIVKGIKPAVFEQKID